MKPGEDQQNSDALQIRLLLLIEEVEVEQHTPRIISEESAKLRVGNIGVYFQRIEVIGEVQQARG